MLDSLLWRYVFRPLCIQNFTVNFYKLILDSIHLILITIIICIARACMYTDSPHAGIFGSEVGQVEEGTSDSLRCHGTMCHHCYSSGECS